MRLHGRTEAALRGERHEHRLDAAKQIAAVEMQDAHVMQALGGLTKAASESGSAQQRRAASDRRGAAAGGPRRKTD
jgi:hypothetical protein